MLWQDIVLKRNLISQLGCDRLLIFLWFLSLCFLHSVLEELCGMVFQFSLRFKGLASRTAFSWLPKSP